MSLSRVPSLTRLNSMSRKRDSPPRVLPSRVSTVRNDTGLLTMERFPGCNETTLYDSLCHRMDVTERSRFLDYPRTDIDILCDVLGKSRVATLMCLDDCSPLLSLPPSVKCWCLEFCLENLGEKVDPIIFRCITEHGEEDHDTIRFYECMFHSQTLRCFFLRNHASDSFARFLGMFVHHACRENNDGYEMLFRSVSDSWLNADFLRNHGATIFRTHESISDSWSLSVARCVLLEWYIPAFGSHVSTMHEGIRLFLEHTLSPWRSAQVFRVLLDYLHTLGDIMEIVDTVDTVFSVFLGDQESLAEWSVLDLCELFSLLERNRSHTSFPKSCLKCMQRAILLFEFLMVDDDDNHGFLFDMSQSGSVWSMLGRAKSFMTLVGHEMFSKVPKDYTRIVVKATTLYALKFAACNLCVLVDVVKVGVVNTF